MLVGHLQRDRFGPKAANRSHDERLRKLAQTVAWLKNRNCGHQHRSRLLNYDVLQTAYFDKTPNPIYRLLLPTRCSNHLIRSKADILFECKR